jgi:uroporphyrinogen-III synthase
LLRPKEQQLAGLHFIITRPLNQSKPLQTLISCHGAIPILFPTLEIQSIRPTELASIIDAINQYEILIFTSKNAVDHFITFLPRSHKSQIAAIGPTTAKTLAGYDLAVDLLPEKFDSEHLLLLLKKQPLQGKQILIISGEGGRTLLETALTSLGAKITKLPVYRRLCPKVDPEILKDMVQKKNSLLLITSCDSFQNLLSICQHYEKEAWLHHIPMVVISDRIRHFMESVGFSSQRLLVAHNGTDQAILDRAIKWYARD